MSNISIFPQVLTNGCVVAYFNPLALLLLLLLLLLLPMNPLFFPWRFFRPSNLFQCETRNVYCLRCNLIWPSSCWALTIWRIIRSAVELGSHSIHVFFFLTCTYDCMIMVDICVINVDGYTINGSYYEKCDTAGWVFGLLTFFLGNNDGRGGGLLVVVKKDFQGEAKPKNRRKPPFLAEF